jgi:tumor protein p53-inducible protein 3
MVLVHAAGSGVGTSAIQLALAAKAVVIATAGSQSKLDYVRKKGEGGGKKIEERV